MEFRHQMNTEQQIWIQDWYHYQNSDASNSGQVSRSFIGIKPSAFEKGIEHRYYAEVIELTSGRCHGICIEEYRWVNCLLNCLNCK